MHVNSSPSQTLTLATTQNIQCMDSPSPCDSESHNSLNQSQNISPCKEISHTDITSPNFSIDQSNKSCPIFQNSNSFTPTIITSSKADFSIFDEDTTTHKDDHFRDMHSKLSGKSPTTSLSIPSPDISHLENPLPNPQHTTPQNNHSMQTRGKNHIHKPLTKLNPITIHFPNQPLEPTSVTQALKQPQWCAAMSNEFNALLHNGTRTLVPPNPSQNVVGCKWVFHISHMDLLNARKHNS